MLYLIVAAVASTFPFAKAKPTPTPRSPVEDERVTDRGRVDQRIRVLVRVADGDRVRARPCRPG